MFIPWHKAGYVDRGVFGNDGKPDHDRVVIDTARAPFYGKYITPYD